MVNGENEQSEGHRGTTNGNDDGVLKEDGKLSRVAPAWLAESTPNEFTVGSFLCLGNFCFVVDSLNLGWCVKLTVVVQISAVILQEMLLKSDSSQGVKYLQTMVECLALLGKITAAGSIIRWILWTRILH